MGIPSYFSTIKKKYARNAGEWMLPTLPNNVSCKHLYVDLNGIVHTCAFRVVSQYEKHLIETHRHMAFKQLQAIVAERADAIVVDILQPQIFGAVVAEVQALLDTVRPTDLCYLALDGVAPRAKMEQQRQRRHRAVADKSLEQAVYNKHKQAFLRGALWDSNCVTPGTAFMDALSVYLHGALGQLVCGEGCVVELSDASVCGEGEHKIMDHMRRCGDPNAGATGQPLQAYVLHGQDADLIMLAFSFLSMHGAHIPFYLLRDSTDPRATKKGDGADAEGGAEASQKSPDAEAPCTSSTNANADTTTLHTHPHWAYTCAHHELNVQFLSTNVLMRCVLRHMESYGDLYTESERPCVIRDYVVLCFLLGNDFLPHSPALSIQDKGIDTLFEAYVPLRKASGGYLVCVVEREGCAPEAHWNTPLFVSILNKLAQQEDYLAGRLHTNTLQKRKWMLQQQRYPKDSQTSKNTPFNPSSHKQMTYTLEHELRHLQTLPPSFWQEDDRVLAGTPQWKSRYYKEIERVRNMADVHLMCRNYVSGLFWSLQYYMYGCWSTMWYYPHLSAPLFSNMLYYLQQPRVNINRLVARDTRWHYTPVAQLLTVMPKESLEKYVYKCFVNVNDKTKTKTKNKSMPTNAPPITAPPISPPTAPLTPPTRTNQLPAHPLSYRLVPFSKRFRWECPVRLPFVDDARVLALQRELVACSS